jgi:glycosyltransferase involved in cell wall biosynthesis
VPTEAKDAIEAEKTPLSLSGRRALVVVPAYNEEEAIGRTVRDLRRHAPWADVLVVNDGSTDGTAGAARAAGAKVVNLPVNLGIGGAVQTGYRYAYENDYDLAFQFDGDGQHRARRLQELAQPILDGETDMIVGSRFIRPRGMTARGSRWAGIKILAVAVSMVTGMKITDPTSGFRGGGRKVIRLFAQTYPQDYPEPESLVLVHKQGLRVLEVPATMRRRRGGVSSINFVKGIYYMAKVLLAVLMEAMKAPVRLEEEST